MLCYKITEHVDFDRIRPIFINVHPCTVGVTPGASRIERHRGQGRGADGTFENEGGHNDKWLIMINDGDYW